MKFASPMGAIAGLTIAAALALRPAPGLAQTTEVYTPSVTTTQTTTTTTTTAPVVNPNDPAQFPPAGVGMNPDSHEGKVKAAYVDQQIALAKARGEDTSAAETQEVMGQAALMHGLDTEAAQHFDAALRAVGVMPSWPEHNSGEAGSLHAPMP
jgi:hypothetical protein